MGALKDYLEKLGSTKIRELLNDFRSNTITNSFTSRDAFKFPCEYTYILPSQVRTE